MTSRCDSKLLLHIIVVGFHHKKGCQVEFSYPPLVPDTGECSGEVPLEWKHLPTLALPDGAHNYSKDTIYFHLKDKKDSSNTTVYGVSCYRQIDAKDIVNKTDDITRGTVQKSVCVLTTMPCFGAVAAKLELVTHAWFEQKDFTQLDLLKDAFNSLSLSLISLSSESQATMGLQLHEVVKLYKYKILVLFKLIMLERKTIFFMTPVSDLCNVILSLLSLFPGLLELGLVESVQPTKTPILTPTTPLKKETFDEEPFVEVSHSQLKQLNISSDTSVESSFALSEPADLASSALPTADSSLPAALNRPTSKELGSLEAGDVGKAQVESIKNHAYLAAGGVDCSALELDSADALYQIDLEDQENYIWSSSRSRTLALTDGENQDLSLTEPLVQAERKSLTIDISQAKKKVEVVPILSPTSITIDKAGLPLAIFTKGSVCHPYLSLSYYDILEDINIRSFVIGASNVLFKQKKQNIDVLVEKSPNVKKDEPAGIVIMDKELQKQLQLTTEDLRFAHFISNRVEETAATGEFLEATEWEGGDEWIRAQFKDYLQSLMASVLAEDNNLLEAFNIHFVNAWKSTHNYKVWRNTVQQLEDVIPGHPYQGGVTLNDVKLQLARSERGRKINAAVDLAGKTVGEALTSAKSFVSSWWSNKSPTDTQPPTEDGGT